MKTSHAFLSPVILLSIVSLLIGCKDNATPRNVASPVNGQSDPHDQAHTHEAGPHDGTLADWGGGEFHVEFTVDHDQQQATVYVLGSDAKTPAPITAEEIQLSIKDPQMQVTLKAAPQAGDTADSAARFVGHHESLGVVQEYEGTITGVVDDTPYSGNFKEEPHDHNQ